ncbi:MAG: hypothetical protein V2J55_11395 [Candidatus Competibacteraceae bacterium]|jgi:small-conductance mechanosensitive channel|nr:hypothetical protein [Candidatus Competibacteraceae bacterium]
MSTMQHLTRLFLAWLMIALSIGAVPVLAKDPAPVESPTEPAAIEETAAQSPELQQAIDRLTDIHQSLSDKRPNLDELKQQVNKAREDERKQELQEDLTDLQNKIQQLNSSFERIAIGGIDLSIFSDEPEAAFNWQEELIEITRPILSGLKELTDKPRKIEELRSQINRQEDQLEIIDKALDSITVFQGHTLPAPVEEKLKGLAADWQQRRSDIEQELENARFQLASLQGNDVSPLEAVQMALDEFLRGRGLTLGLAALAFIAVWVFMRTLLWVHEKAGNRRNQKQRIKKARLIRYSYRLLTGVFAVFAVLIVFYLRSDLLLLVLAILALVVLGLGLRQTLPRYITEIRLLLDVGPVRTGERVIYNGIPLQVKSINVYSVLRNPVLEGVIRLPLAMLNELISRPCGVEPWFPCQEGDYVLLPDGRLGQVLRQTLDQVQLKVVGSVVHYPTADFFQLNVRNLSRQGFGLAVTFGIDYRHQAICLDLVPERFQQALITAFENAGLAEQVEDIAVEFKEAGASSLDYLLYLTMKGEAASAYFKLGRLAQQTCVAVCNQENWGIPFGQLTIHQGDGFEALRNRDRIVGTHSD